MAVGSGQTRLIVLRGNSGAGKSTVARGLREAYGRGVAWVSQDLIRRIILKELDKPGGANIGLIDQVARYSLDHGYDETVRRHATRPQAAEFGPDDMRQWYKPADLLTAVREHVVPETSAAQDTVSLILAGTRLLECGQARG